jgi:hypothetical protein
MPHLPRRASVAVIRLHARLAPRSADHSFRQPTAAAATAKLLDHPEQLPLLELERFDLTLERLFSGRGAAQLALRRAALEGLLAVAAGLARCRLALALYLARLELGLVTGSLPVDLGLQTLLAFRQSSSRRCRIVCDRLRAHSRAGAVEIACELRESACITGRISRRAAQGLHGGFELADQLLPGCSVGGCLVVV